jgi:hypothetical protein
MTMTDNTVYKFHSKVLGNQEMQTYLSILRSGIAAGPGCAGLSYRLHLDGQEEPIEAGPSLEGTDEPHVLCDIFQIEEAGC